MLKETESTTVYIKILAKFMSTSNLMISPACQRWSLAVIKDYRQPLGKRGGFFKNIMLIQWVGELHNEASGTSSKRTAKEQPGAM